MFNKKPEADNQMTPDPVSRIQNFFTKLTSKTCLFLLFVLVIMGAVYLAAMKLNPNVLSLMEQQRLFVAVADEIHQIPFEQLESSRFEKDINNEKYVVTVIMDDIATIPQAMMGDTVPGVEDPFISPQKNYLMRSFLVEIMYLPKNLFSLPIDAEPQIIKQGFFAVKRNNEDYTIVAAAPIKQQYAEQTRLYRENLKKEAEEYIKKRDGQK